VISGKRSNVGRNSKRKGKRLERGKRGSAMKEKSKGLKESKKAPQRSLKEKRKAKKEKKNVGFGGGSPLS
jgi:hypothetical protein